MHRRVVPCIYNKIKDYKKGGSLFRVLQPVELVCVYITLDKRCLLVVASIQNGGQSKMSQQRLQKSSSSGH